MIQPRFILTIATMLLVFALLCAPQAQTIYANQQTSNATAAATRAGTPTRKPAVVAKSGQWEGGQTPVRFEITSDGKIRNFELVVPQPPGLVKNQGCVVSVPGDISIAPDGSFVASETTEKKAVPELTSIVPRPPSTRAASGEFVDVYRVTGKFRNGTSISGTYRAVKCALGRSTTYFFFRGNWSADFIGELPDSPQSYPKVTLGEHSAQVNKVESGVFSLGKLFNLKPKNPAKETAVIVFWQSTDPKYKTPTAITEFLSLAPFKDCVIEDSSGKSWTAAGSSLRAGERSCIFIIDKKASQLKFRLGDFPPIDLGN